MANKSLKKVFSSLSYQININERFEFFPIFFLSKQMSRKSDKDVEKEGHWDKY